MLALALVLEGQSRTDAAETCGMDRQSLRDWVHRYNAEGLAGLTNRRAPGRMARLSAEQQAAVERWVEQGPDLERDGVVRWRCRDLQARVAKLKDGRTRLTYKPEHAVDLDIDAVVAAEMHSADRARATTHARC